MNVLINKLELTDFMSVEHAIFNFKKRVNFIQGPAASGKSTILEAISICFSSQKRGDSYKDYVRNGKNFGKVYLEAMIDTKPIIFDLTLYRKGGTAYTLDLTYDGGTYHNTECDQVIAKLDLDFFSTLTMYMQHDAEISALSPMERLIYIRRLVEISFQDDVESEKKTCDELKQSITNKKNELAAIQGAISVLKTQRVPVVDEDEIEAARVKLESLQKKASEAQAELEEFYKKQDEIKAQIAVAEREIKEYNQQILEYETYEKQKNQLDLDVSAYSQKINEYNKELTSINSDIEKLNQDYGNAAVTLSCDSGAIAVYNESVASKNRIIKLIKQGCCPECGQKTDVLGDLTKIEAEKEADEKSLDSLSKEYDEVDEKSRKLSDEISKLQQKKVEVQMRLNYANNSLSTANDKLSRLIQPTGSEAEALSAIAAKEELINGLKSQVSRISRPKDVSMNELTEANAVYSELLAQKKNIELIQANNENVKKVKMEKQEQLNKANDDLKTINSDYDAHFEVFTMLKKHLPGYMSSIICAHLQEEMNSIINSVFPNISIIIEHSLKGCNILVKRPNEDPFSSRMCSGLEQSTISVAFKLALIRMYHMNMFIGDEIDKFSDDENAIKLFENIIDDPSLGQVFIITHKPGLVDDFKSTRSNVDIYNMLYGHLTN